MRIEKKDDPKKYIEIDIELFYDILVHSGTDELFDYVEEELEIKEVMGDKYEEEVMLVSKELKDIYNVDEDLFALHNPIKEVKSINRGIEEELMSLAKEHDLAGHILYSSKSTKEDRRVARAHDRLKRLLDYGQIG